MNALLICPDFFDYAVQIEKAIERQGLQCVRLDEKPSNMALAKIIIRLFGQKKIVQKFLLASLKKKVNDLKIDSFDYIIIVKAECISGEFMMWLKEKYKESKFVFYAWDSIKNYPHVENLLHHFNKSYSFDKNDAIEYEHLQHLPLFYSPHYNKSSVIPKANKISFIGSYHSDRFYVLKKICEKYSAAYDLNFTLYFPSIILLLSFIIKNIKSLSALKHIKITLKSISGETIAKEYNNSIAVIDVHHPYQNGLTMRVIELLPLERKIITTNDSITSYPFYNVNNICIIKRDNPVIEQFFIASDFVHSDISFTSNYSIDSWAETLLTI
ncbi:hypothetical protein ACA365_08155 [Enterobacter roggenkampii]|uniref:hypothetical protein n=1 Tax=Enterobacter roggenkampii TaxID=1812935 RepID=UPI003B9F9809